MRERNTIPRRIKRLQARFPYQNRRINVNKYKCCCCGEPLKKDETCQYNDMYDMSSGRFRKEAIIHDSDRVCNSCYVVDLDEMFRFIVDSDISKVWREMQFERYREGIPREERISRRKRLR